jgi:hypothetical protein
MKILVFLLLANFSHATELDRRKFLQGSSSALATLKMSPSPVLADTSVDPALAARSLFYRKNLINIDQLIESYLRGPTSWPSPQVVVVASNGLLQSIPIFSGGGTPSLKEKIPAKLENVANEFVTKLANVDKRVAERLGLSFTETSVQIDRTVLYPLLNGHSATKMSIAEANFENVFFEELGETLPTLRNTAKMIYQWSTDFNEANSVSHWYKVRKLPTSESSRRIRQEIEAMGERFSNMETVSLTDAHQKIVTILRQRACAEILNESASDNERVLELEYPLQDASSDPLRIPSNSR